MTLFTYCIPIDKGDAPNPFWDICTLAICKPGIRRNAKPGDWVAGTGSKEYGMANQLVYAMKVSQTMTFEEYDLHCKLHLLGKIPDWDSKDLRRKAGDCIYNFEKGAPPSIRESVHDEGNRNTDLGGRNVLLSDHFYYFGSQPVDLPCCLLPIVHQTQGYKSIANRNYADKFAEWMETFSASRNKILADPYLINELNDNSCVARCRKRDAEEDLADDEDLISYC